VFFTWAITGTIFYALYDYWTIATAFYYAMEGGLSVGFCNPAERNEYSQLFTIFFVLCGSSVVAGTLGYCVSYLSGANNSSFKLHEHNYDTFLLFDDQHKLTATRFVHFLWYQIKYWTGWYSNRTRAVAIVLLLCCLTVGTAYGVFLENWTFISALYFAVSTAATGGLQSPPCIRGTGATCDVGPITGWIVGIYCAFGVPSKFFYWADHVLLSLALSLFFVYVYFQFTL
jgi:hypothetical protein